ncbi:MAG: pathogenicity locus [Candidatus Lokiarchaeota archaeon]|nr:pathogenicity locus [Candidatus Lokiarchaeota archaeon]
MDKIKSIQELSKIPGVGKKIAESFWNVNITSINHLKGENPELLYEKICNHQEKSIDKCLLYVCRCAVYFASNQVHDPLLLKWWNWKK